MADDLDKAKRKRETLVKILDGIERCFKTALFTSLIGLVSGIITEYSLKYFCASDFLKKVEEGNSLDKYSEDQGISNDFEKSLFKNLVAKKNPEIKINENTYMLKPGQYIKLPYIYTDNEIEVKKEN